MKYIFTFLIVASAAAFAPAHAQQAAGGDARADDPFARARRLIAAGQDDSGRAVVQAELNAAEPGSPRYVEALYWRAVLAATAAAAEHDLRTLVIEYPLSTYTDDALMRLAQLEMTRGENDQALAHLQRLVREHSHSASRPRASFWMARLLFDAGKAPQACAQLTDAAATTPDAQVELRNQIDYLNQRCAGINTVPAAVAGQQTRAPVKGAPVQGGRVQGAQVTKPAPGVPAAPANPAAQQAVQQAPQQGPQQAPRPAPQPAPQQAPPQAPEFTIQVAAFSNFDSAVHIRERLSDLGFDARVAGSEPPYRVRVGRYPTRAVADSVAARMKIQHVDGYVTRAEPRP